MELPDLNQCPLDEGDYIPRAIGIMGGARNAGGVKEPGVGMVFLNPDDFGAFCYTYAYQTGFEFSHRTSDLLKEFVDKGVKRNGRGDMEPQLHMMSRIRLQCTKAGKSKKPRSSKTGCPVFVEARRAEDGRMSVRGLLLAHNHPVDPSNSRFMVSFREISAYFKGRMMLNDAAGIPITNNFHALALECGGVEYLPFNARDLRNCINLERRADRVSGDADAVLVYFLKLRQENPDFFFAIDKDAEGRLTRIFWSDARCRGMCKVFGDAVTFDTTFLSNRYGMSFAPFVGVNHHGSSVCFAAALIVNEDADSFIWIFKKWMECMGKAPSVILTDQCKAIGKAVRTVFPNTPHRLCLWHIMKNAAKNLGSLKEWKKIDKVLQVVVHDSLDEFDFCEAWAEMVAKFELEENPWITEAYEIRRSWAPAYWRDTFCAGMSSTQRSEQSNRFFKMYLSVQTGLRQFIKQFEQALKAKVEHEAKKNFACVDKTINATYDLVVEDVFRKVYTSDKYKEVMDEVRGLIYTNVKKIRAIGSCEFYIATEDVVKPVWRAAVKTYQTTVDGANGLFTCSCKLFEFRGILCRHIIRCIITSHIRCIPDRYVLDRWRKDLVRGYENIKVGYYDPGECARVKKAMKVRIRNDYIETLALQDEESFAIYERGTARLSKELQEYIGIDEVNVTGLSVGQGSMTVWGKRRLQSRVHNQRHIIRSTTAGDVDHIVDPVDKRKVGRAQRVRQKAAKRKRDEGPSTASRQRNVSQSQNTPASAADLSLP